jgi:hypothetical protein
VGSTKSLKLSALVTDPDQSKDATKYSWQLFTADGASVYQNNQLVTLPTTDTIEFNVFNLGLSAGISYMAELKVAKGSRTITVQHTFEVKAGDPPAVIANAPLGNQNPSSKILILGKISSSVLGNYAWECVNNEEDSEYGFITVDSTTAIGAFSGMYLAPANEAPANLMIASDALKGGLKYEFQLKGTNFDGVDGKDSTVVVTNSAPTKGVLSVSPTTGISLNTTFVWSVTEGCEDDDRVQYQFAYIDQSAGTLTYFPLQAESELSDVLPPGDNMEMAVVCYDDLGAYAVTRGVYINVTLAPLGDDAINEQAAKIAKLKNEGNTDQLATLAANTARTMAASGGSDNAAAVSFKGGASSNLADSASAGDIQTGSAVDGVFASFGQVTAGGADSFSESLKTSILNGAASLVGGSPTNNNARRRRRRSVDCTTAVTAKTFQQVESILTTQNNLINANSSTSDKNTFLALRDTLSSQFCKQYSSPELKALAKNNIAVFQVYHYDFTTADSTYLELGCPSASACADNTCQSGAATACPANQPHSDSVLLGQSLKDKFVSHTCCDGSGGTTSCSGACVSSVQIPTDLLSVSGVNASIVSNILRLRFWHPTSAHELTVTTLDYGPVLKLTVHRPTSISANQIAAYECVRWDTGNNMWTTDGVTTVDMYGEKDVNNTYVSCNMTTLGDITIVELTPDTNECLTDNGGCHANATCTNSYLSYACACVSPYEGNGVNCSIPDPCLDNYGGCHNDSICTSEGT